MPIGLTCAVRLVLDTNTALSGLLWGGTPAKLLDAAVLGHIQLISSTPLLAELQGVLMRPKFDKQLTRKGLSVVHVFEGYAALVTVVVPASIAPTIIRDPADDQVLAAALSASVDLIVSGDAHLLDLATFQNIPIVDAASALRLL